MTSRWLFISLAPLVLAAASGPSARAAADSAASSGDRATLPVKVELIDGAALSGALRGIDASGRINLIVDGRDVPIEPGEAARISIRRQSVSDGAGAQTTQPAPDEERVCRLYFADGSVIDAAILPAAEGDRNLRVRNDIVGVVEFPLSILAGARCAAAPAEAAEAELRARLADRREARDVLIVDRAGAGPLVLPGALEGLSPDSWRFRIGDKVQSGALDKAYGFVLGGASRRAAASPVEAHFGTEAGASQSVRGRSIQTEGDSIVVRDSSLGEMRLPAAQVRSIDFHSERIVFLSDLTAASVEQRSIFDVSWPPRMDASVAGGPILLDGRRYERGIGVHAYTALTYSLEGRYEQFLADVGVNDGASRRGRAVFRVLCDERVAYESPPMTPGARESVRVDLRAVQRLTLVCEDGGDLDVGDHCDWAAARLVRARSDVIR